MTKEESLDNMTEELFTSIEDQPIAELIEKLKSDIEYLGSLEGKKEEHSEEYNEVLLKCVQDLYIMFGSQENG